MDTPSANADGYNHSSLMARAEATVADLQDRSAYLLVHGTADDNVHFQNAADLEATLTRLNVQYRAQWYSDQDHSLGAARRHLYTLIGAFISESHCSVPRMRTQGDGLPLSAV